MLTAIILLATIPGWSNAQDGEVILPDNKTECAMAMVQWCKKMQYPEEGAGMTMESITYETPDGLYKVFCSSDSDGTVCTKNSLPWFSCTPNNQATPGNTFTYNGQVLTENITSDTSANLDNICADADRGFNDLYIQKLSYQNESLKEEVQQTFEAMFQEISDMREQMDQMKAQMDLFSIFFKRDMMGGLNGDVPNLQNQNDATTTLAPSNSTQALNTTEQANEIPLD